jgi:hypothetical protein
MKMDLVSPPLQDGTTQVVVQKDAWYSTPIGKSMDMTAQEVFQSLIKEKFQVESTRIGQSDDKTGEASAGPSELNFAEVSPVDLGVFARESMQAQKGFLCAGP